MTKIGEWSRFQDLWQILSYGSNGMDRDRALQFMSEVIRAPAAGNNGYSGMARLSIWIPVMSPPVLEILTERDIKFNDSQLAHGTMYSLPTRYSIISLRSRTNTLELSESDHRWSSISGGSAIKTVNTSLRLETWYWARDDEYIHRFIQFPLFRNSLLLEFHSWSPSRG